MRLGAVVDDGYPEFVIFNVIVNTLSEEVTTAGSGEIETSTFTGPSEDVKDDLLKVPPPLLTASDSVSEYSQAFPVTFVL